MTYILFKWQYPLLYLRSSSRVLRLLSRRPVTTIPSFTFLSITRCRRQFLRKMWSIELAFRLIISCWIFLCSLTLSNTSSFLTFLVQLNFPPFSSTTFQNTHNSDIKQYCCFSIFPWQQSKLAESLDRSVYRYWIIVPLLVRRWVQSSIHSADVEPPRLWALLVLIVGDGVLFTGDGMTRVWWRCACSVRLATCAYSIYYDNKFVYSFFHSMLWLFVNIRPRLIFSCLGG